MTIAAPVVVGSPTYGESNNVVMTTLTVPKPAGVQNGDILIAVLRNGTSAQATDYTLAGWTRRAIIPFPTVTAANRLTGLYTHFVTDAPNEPASYVFTVAGNTFNRQAGMMFIVRPAPGSTPWAEEPVYTSSTGWTGGPPPFASAFPTQPDALIIWGVGNELIAPNPTASWTPPPGSVAIGIHGSLTDQANTGSTRAVVAAAYEVSTATAAGGSGDPITLPAYSSAAPVAISIPGTPAPYAAQNQAGATVYLSEWNGTAEKNLAEVGIWYPGYPSVDALLTGGDKPTMAHRGGSLSYPEMSEWAYDHAVMRGFGALEMSVAWSSDLVPFGNGDQYLDRMVLDTATSTLDPTTMTWAQINGTYQNLLRPIKVGVYQPLFKLVDFLAKYTPTHVCIVDPKYGFANAPKVAAMLDICDANGGPSKIIIKFDSPTTNTILTSAAHARGYKCMNYWNADTTAMAAEQANWDIIGANYAQAAALAQAKTYGKPVWAAIVPDQAGYATALANGADLVMISGVANVLPSTWWT